VIPVLLSNNCARIGGVYVYTLTSDGASHQLALKLTHKLKYVLTRTGTALEQTVPQSVTGAITSDRSHCAGNVHPLTSTCYPVCNIGPYQQYWSETTKIAATIDQSWLRTPA